MEQNIQQPDYAFKLINIHPVQPGNDLLLPSAAGRVLLDEPSSEYTPCPEKIKPLLFWHNFNKFKRSFVIFGKNHPDTSTY